MAKEVFITIQGTLANETADDLRSRFENGKEHVDRKAIEADIMHEFMQSADLPVIEKIEVFDI